MKSKLYLLISVLLMTVGAQAQQSKFTKVFYDPQGWTQSYSLEKLFDHNYVIVGYKDNFPMVIKTDQEGNILYCKQVGDNGGKLFCVTSTLDSCFVAGGLIYNPVTEDNDILVVKMKSNGDTLWSRMIDMGFDDACVSVRQTSDNGFILAGYASQMFLPYSLGILIKLDFQGNLVWGKNFAGGNYNNHPYSVVQLPDSSFIVTGYMENYPPFDGGMFFIKFSPSGSILWSKRLLSSLNDYSVPNDLLVDNGNIVCYYSTINEGLMLMKMDFQGNVRWNYNNSVFAGGNLTESGPKLHKTSDGDYLFVSGYQFGGGFMLKTDTAGNLLWTRDLFLAAVDAVESADGGFMITGNGPLIGVSPIGTTNPQIGVIKTDSDGNSSFCVNPGGIYSNTLGINLDTVVFTITSQGNIQNIHPVLKDIVLSVDTGCVAFLGAIKENKRPSGTLTVYPNPSNGKVYYKTEGFGTDEIESIEIFDSQGAKVLESDHPSVLHSTIDLTDRPDGIYMLLVRTADGILSQKIMISH